MRNHQCSVWGRLAHTQRGNTHCQRSNFRGLLILLPTASERLGGVWVTVGVVDLFAGALIAPTLPGIGRTMRVELALHHSSSVTKCHAGASKSLRSQHAAACKLCLRTAARSGLQGPTQPQREGSLHICRASASISMPGGLPEPAPQQRRRPLQLGTGAQFMQQLRRMVAAFPIGWVLMLSYLIFMLLIPIAALLYKASRVPLEVFIARATEPVAMHAYEVTLLMGGIACVVNALFGLLLAWVLVKFDFPGKKWIDAAVDIPFALPTSVAGLTLSTVYNEDGLLGQFLTKMGVDVVFNQAGVCLAMIFVSFPFVVRTMQPVIQEMEREAEEASWTLGASPLRTFLEVQLPPLLPALLTGSALAFSRAIGEFGSIVIISSNFPFKDLIAPVLIFQCLEQYDFVGATVIGTVLLGISLGMMLVVNWLQTFKQSAPR